MKEKKRKPQIRVQWHIWYDHQQDLFLCCSYLIILPLRLLFYTTATRKEKNHAEFLVVDASRGDLKTNRAINGWSCGYVNFLIFTVALLLCVLPIIHLFFLSCTRRYASSYGRSWPEKTEAILITRWGSKTCSPRKHIQVSWPPIFPTNHGKEIMNQLSQWKTRRKYQRIKVRLLLMRNMDSIVAETSWTDWTNEKDDDSLRRLGFIFFSGETLVSSCLVKPDIRLFHRLFLWGQ